MSWLRKLSQAKKRNKELKENLKYAQEFFALNAENKVMEAKFGIAERAHDVLVEAQVRGMQDGLKKTLPELAKSQRESSAKAMTGYLKSVRDRAALPQSK